MVSSTSGRALVVYLAASQRYYYYHLTLLRIFHSFEWMEANGTLNWNWNWNWNCNSICDRESAIEIPISNSTHKQQPLSAVFTFVEFVICMIWMHRIGFLLITPNKHAPLCSSVNSVRAFGYIGAHRTARTHKNARVRSQVEWSKWTISAVRPLSSDQFVSVHLVSPVTRFITLDWICIGFSIGFVCVVIMLSFV